MLSHGLPLQLAKKSMSDSPGLVDFAVGLADFMGKLAKLRRTFWVSENDFRANTFRLQLALIAS